MFDRGQPVDVVVSNLLPCIYHEPILLGSTPCIWHMMLLKAIAKEKGSWEALNRCNHAETLRMLTGVPVHEMDLAESDDFGYIQEAMEDTSNIYIMTLEVPRDNDEMKGAVADAGFDPDYCYCIRDAKEVDGTKLIQLFHPDDDFRWTGDFGPDSDRWTPELKEACNYNPENEDGCFWMEFDQAI